VPTRPFTPNGLFDSSSFEEAIRDGFVDAVAAGASPAKVRSAVPDVVARTLDAQSDVLRQALKDRASEMLRDHTEIRRGFETRLLKSWGTALDAYYEVLIATVEAGAQFRGEYTPGRYSRRARFEAISQIHAKACLIASEIHALLRTGFPTGAHARYRALHESAVIATVLGKSVIAISERFIAYGSVEAAQDVAEYQAHAAALGQQPLPQSEDDAIVRRKDKVMAKYGKGFDANYGWARPLFPAGKGPSFRKLQALAGLEHMQPYYRLASHHSHAGPKGTALNRRPFRGDSILLAGPTNAGLSEVGHGALLSLTQTTVALLVRAAGRQRNPVGVVIAKTLLKMVDEAGEVFATCERNVAEAEKRIRRDVSPA
jgi:hypothetical protein